MTGAGLLVRWIHLASGLLLVGIFTFLLLAGRSDRPSARGWEGRVLRLTRWLLAALLLSGITLLALQSAVITGRPGAALEPGAWLGLLGGTQFGTVWLVRHGLLLLLAALILLREREESAPDWAALRLEAWLLCGFGMGAMAWAGHAAAVEPGAFEAALLDALHLVAAGAWLGALVPLALLLRAASSESGADARPYAVLAARRFSSLALVTMLAVIATGLWNTWNQVGGFPALVGTRYGWLVMLKVGLLVPILALAGMNRKRFLPALSGDGPTIGRPAMARLGRFVTLECALGLLILLVVAALSLTPPGRHDSAWWPFSYRLSYEATRDLPGAKTRLLLGSQLALVGLLGGVVGLMVGKRRRLVIPLALIVLGTGIWLALDRLRVDAYPTTFKRSTVPYHALSIASGEALYQQHCAVCHGASGTGDGPGGAGLPKRPADLTAPHTAQHTAGDLFWWITRGIPVAGMPPFGDRLTEEDRWDLINFLRALSAADQARGLDEVVEPDRPWLVAPDASFAVGPSSGRALKDLRKRRHVLLVLFTSSSSRERVNQLAETYEALQGLGAEIVAVPLDGAEEIITRLGAKPPILFPIATEGGPEIIRAYGLFRRTLTPGGNAPEPMPSHMEFLIDRQGYLRARWIPGGSRAGWADPRALMAEIQRLNQETPTGPPPDEHVH